MHDHLSNTIDRINPDQVRIPADMFNDFRCGNMVEEIDYFDGSVETTPCPSNTFDPILRLKVYTGILSSGQTVVMQIPAFQCTKCGKVHDKIS